jgi:multiple sugar transport system permease protein
MVQQLTPLGRMLLYVAGVAATIFTLAPIAWLLMLALKTQLDAFAVPPKLIFSPTWQHFRDVAADPTFLRAARNSLVIALGSVTSAMLLALPAAYGLTNIRGTARRSAMLTVLLLRTFPGMIFLIPFFVIYNRLGLLDTHLGMIIVYTMFNVPLVIWMLLPIWQSLPRELGEAARIDGATLLQTLWFVELPLVRSAIAAAAILAFVFCWNEFLFALILTRRQTITLPVAIINYMAYEGTEWGKIAAAAIFIMTPVVIFGFLIRRYLISSFTAGAVKG